MVDSAGAFVIRWMHLLASMSAVGALAFVVLAGRSDRATAVRWEARVIVWARRFVVLALLSGVAVLLIQTATFVGRADAAFEPAAVARVLTSTRAGFVWLIRYGLLLLLAAFLSVRSGLDQKLDWLAVRGESLGLSLGAAALVSFSSHAAAVTPGTIAAVIVDALHVIGTGVWAGGLLPLAALSWAASAEAGADARAYAVRSARRFSRFALVAVLTLIATGIVNSVNEIGSVAGLVGTTHGRLLMGKLALLAPILVLGAVNRTRVLPALSGPGDMVGRPAMRRLARFVAIEAGLAAAILAIVAVMTATPPGRHEQPTWPLPFRLTYAAIAGTPALETRVLIAGQLAVLGVVALIASALVRHRRWPVLAGGLILVAIGAGVALPPLAVHAYPWTYHRPITPYTVDTIAAGATIFRERCASCHGATGEGDGPAGRGLSPPPADLRSGHTGRHTAGDLFWVISRGIPGSPMPAFESQLGARDRWAIVNFIRTLTAGDSARKLGATMEPERPRIVAPDFTFSIGPSASHALKDYRGRRIVLLVLYSWPASRDRLAELAAGYESIVARGAEVIAVPLDASPDAIKKIGAAPRIFFPIVTEGAAPIVQGYRLFGAGGGHAEFLIDRQGYLRARWAIAPPATRDVNRLLAELQRLNEEKTPPPPAAEHVH